MDIPFTGGCACGAIRYECTAKPIMMINCHCRDCQRASGGPYAAAMIVPSKAFKVTQGTPRYFGVSNASGGTHTRGFCGECGSRLFGAVDPASPIIGITAPSLDDPSCFAPQMDIFTSEAQPWDHMNPALAKYEQYMPME